MQSSSSSAKVIRAATARGDELLTRRAEIEVRQGEGEGQNPGSFSAVFSSDAPLLRSMEIWNEPLQTWEIRQVEEILSHEAGAPDLSRLESPGGLNFLQEHYGDVVGRVSDAQLGGGKLRGRINVDVGTPEGEVLSGQWQRGFNTSLSIGYSILQRREEVDEETGTLRIIATRWALNEVSSVSVSADANAAVGARSHRFGTLVGKPQGERQMNPQTHPAGAGAPPASPPPPVIVAPAASDPNVYPSQGARSGETTASVERQLETLQSQNARRERAEQFVRIYTGQPGATIEKINKVRDIFHESMERQGSFQDAQDRADAVMRGTEHRPSPEAGAEQTHTRAIEAHDNGISLGSAGVWLLARSKEGIDAKTRTQHGLVREFSQHVFDNSEFLQGRENGTHPEDVIYIPREFFQGFTLDQIRQERVRQMVSARALRLMGRASRVFTAEDNPVFTGQANADGTAQSIAGNADTMAEQDTFRPDLFLGEARPRLSLETLGVSYLNVSSDIDIPLQNGTLAAGWNTETGRLREDSFTTTRITQKPERYGLQTNMTTLRRIKDVLPIETIMRNEAVFAMEKLVEEGLINGTGLANQITGLLRWTGIPVYNEPGSTLGWNLTINNLLLMKENFLLRNEFGPFSLLLTPRLETIARTIPTGILQAPSENRLLPIPSAQGNILEHPYAASPYVPTNGIRSTATGLHTMVMGDFKELFRIDYGPIRIGVDPYSGLDRSLTKFTWEGFTSSLVRNTDAFLIAKNLNSTL